MSNSVSSGVSSTTSIGGTDNDTPLTKFFKDNFDPNKLNKITIKSDNPLGHSPNANSPKATTSLIGTQVKSSRWTADNYNDPREATPRTPPTRSNSDGQRFQNIADIITNMHIPGADSPGPHNHEVQPAQNDSNSSETTIPDNDPTDTEDEPDSSNSTA